MERARLLDLLGDHHRHINALLEEALAALDSTDSSKAKVLALIRWQLMRRLRSYQLFKHTELFAPLIRGSDVKKAASARAMEIRCVDTSQSYNKHVRKWSVYGIGDDWSGYETDAMSVISLLKSRLARELREASDILAPANCHIQPTKDARS